MSVTALAMALGLMLPAALNAQTSWLVRSASTPPGNTQYRGHMASDTARGTVVYLKSTAFNTPALTYIWNGATWATGPALFTVTGLQNQNLAYDAARQRVVFFGGNPFSHGNWNETFEWDGIAWTQMTPTVRPTARHVHAMAYDARRARIVVFGGNGASSTLGDTWTYDGTTWVQAATTGPSPRHSSSMTYDTIARRIVLFGGRDVALGTERNDTWLWDGTVWSQAMPATIPPPRREHYMTFDAARQRVVMHGGFGLGVVDTDTWEWDGENWSRYSTAQINIFGPMAYDTTRNEVIELAHGQTYAYSSTVSGHVPGVSPLWDDATVAAGDGPRGIAVVGRSSGVRDLAVANSNAASVRILTNGGSGTFSSGPTIALTASSPVAVASGNLDSGPTNDLAVACEAPVTPGSYRVAKILQAGEGGQAVSYVTTLGLKPVHVACADLTGDLLDDIVVACVGEPLVGGGIEVIRTGGAHTQISTTKTARVVACDLDGDGDRDLVGLGQSPDTLDFFANDGSGGFTAAGSIALGTSGSAKAMCCGDMDGDGDLDLVVLVPDLFGANRFAVYVNNGALALTAGNVSGGKFATAGPISTTGTLALDVACGDFEDDTIDVAGIAFTGKSRKDVCLLNAVGAPVVHDAFSGAAFATTLRPGSGANPVACVVADLNNDGCDDVAIANQGSDDVTINLTFVPTIAEPFATGCTGGSGVPTIASTGTPRAGSTDFSVSVANARPSALALLAFSLTAAGAPGAACNVFVASPIVTVFTFTSGAGAATFPLGIPSGIPKGSDAYLQWAVFDPAGAFLGTLALSNALRVQIGN